MASAFFLPLPNGARFCIYHAPNGGGRKRGVVYVHPFGEEMHKARRMAALQSRRLAAEGYAVLQIDLYGCGDSAGDFADTRWEEWVHDVRRAIAWLKQRLDGAVSLWGLRLGATLAAEVARDRAIGVDHLLLWQPVPAGEQFLSQFLRLRLAGEMLAAGAATTALHELRRELAQGRSVEIAGYELPAQLASAIATLDLAAMLPAVQHVHWLEVGAEAGAPLRPASRRVVAAWATGGFPISTAIVPGEPFWSTIEIAECEALLGATLDAINSLN